MTILRGQSIHFNFELLKRVRERQRQIQIVFRIAVRPSVQQVVQAAVHSAADLNHNGGIVSDTRIKRVVRCRNRSPSEKDQLRWITAIQRQLQNTLVVDDISHAGTARFGKSGIGLDFHLVRDLSDFKDGIHDRIRSNLQNDSGLYVRLKTRQSSLDRVRPYGQIL